MIHSIEELKEHLEVQFTGKFSIEYKITDIISLRETIKKSPPNYYLIINTIPIPNPITEDKILDTIKTLVLTELLELQSKYKTDKDRLDKINMLINGATLN